MHYRILLVPNDDTLNFDSTLPMISSPFNDVYREVTLASISKFTEGKEISGSGIAYDGNSGVVFPDNIINGIYKIKYNCHNVTVDDIILDSNYPYTMTICKDKYYISTGIVGITITDYTVIRDYIFVYLRYIFSRYDSSDNIKFDINTLSNLIIKLPSREIQRDIAIEGLKVVNDIQKLESLFKSYNLI